MFKVGRNSEPQLVELCRETGLESGSLENEARKSEQKSHKMCQTTWENPRRQSLLVLNLLRRLSEQEAANERLRLEKDQQLKDISSQLLFFESHLRREQERISRLFEEKERRIAEQDKHIEALLRLNRRLAAKRCRTKDDEAKKKSKRQQRRISWHNEVYVITDYDKHWTQTNFRESAAAGAKGSGLGEMRRIEDYGNGTERKNGVEEEHCGMFQREVEEACDSISMVSRESDGDDFNEIVFPIPSVHSSPFRQKDSDAVVKDAGDPSLNVTAVSSEEHGSSSPPPDRINTPNLGVFYNRVMSNHRSVPKPKDVKYKKISRVKSRSLEELRGRLRKQVTHPMAFPAYPLLLESNEETTQ